jgi:hypothetical protein
MRGDSSIGDPDDAREPSRLACGTRHENDVAFFCSSPGTLRAETLTVIARPAWIVRPAALEKPATATLRLIPESTLPGIPVSFLITINNPNDQVLRIGDGINLKGRPTWARSMCWMN